MVKLTLDVYLEKVKVTRYALAKKTGTHYHIIDDYYKNKVVRYDSYLLNKMCNVLNCDISDLISYTKE